MPKGNLHLKLDNKKQKSLKKKEISLVNNGEEMFADTEDLDTVTKEIRKPKQVNLDKKHKNVKDLVGDIKDDDELNFSSDYVDKELKVIDHNDKVNDLSDEEYSAKANTKDNLHKSEWLKTAHEENSEEFSEISTIYGTKKVKSPEKQALKYLMDAKPKKKPSLLNKIKLKISNLTNKISLKRKKAVVKNIDENTTEKDPSKVYGMREPNLSIVSEKKRKLAKRKKMIKKVSIGLIIFMIIATIIGAVSYQYLIKPALRVKASANLIQAKSKDILNDFNNKDITNLDKNINDIKLEMDKIFLEINRFKFLKDWSISKGYYKNLEISKSILEKSEVLLDTTLPTLKDLLKSSGFSVAGAPATDGSLQTDIAASDVVSDPLTEGESAFTLVLKRMPEYLTLYSQVEPQILDIFEEVKKLDPNYIPNIPSLDIASQLAEFEEFATEFPTTAKQVTDFLALTPELLGSNKTTRYLLLLQNETEMRSSGGILTAYGLLTITNGELGDIKLSDTVGLENYVRYDLGINAGPRDFNYYTDYPPYVNESYGYYQNIYGQDVLMNWGCGATSMRVQDSNLYADLNWTMNIFTDYYYWANTYDKERFPDYDHIIMFNQTFAENLLEIVQPVEVEGYGTVTAENFIDFIKQETDRSDLVFNPERKAIIDKIADKLKEKFLDLELEKLPNVMNVVVDSVYAKDIAMASFSNSEVQAFFDKYGFDGRTENEFAGDYFHLNEAQNCALKLNRWVRDEVKQTINIADDGTVTKDVRVNWAQPQIYHPSLGYQYSNTDSHSYRAWIRFFLPKSTQILGSTGHGASGYTGYRPKTYYDETENKEVSDNIIQFDHRRFSEQEAIPGTNIDVSYKLPDYLNYNTNGEYRLLIQKHPGKSWGEKYYLKFNYKGTEYNVDFVLDQDKIITFRDGIITVENYNKKLDWALELVDKLVKKD